MTIIFLTARRRLFFWLQTKFLLMRLGIPYAELHTYSGVLFPGPPDFKGRKMKDISERWDVKFFFDDKQSNLDACAEWVEHLVLVDGKLWPEIADEVRDLIKNL